MAMICGTPTPATMRVVQMEPGPMPTLTASAPASARASAAAPVAMLPPMTSMWGYVLFDPAHAVDHALAVAVRGIHHDGIDAGLDQRGHALLGALAHAHCRADAQFAQGIAGSIREIGCLVMSLTVIKPLSSNASLTSSKRSSLDLVQQGFGLQAWCLQAP
jgi:hypothetical protein